MYSGVSQVYGRGEPGIQGGGGGHVYVVFGSIER